MPNFLATRSGADLKQFLPARRSALEGGVLVCSIVRSKKSNHGSSFCTKHSANNDDENEVVDEDYYYYAESYYAPLCNPSNTSVRRQLVSESAWSLGSSSDHLTPNNKGRCGAWSFSLLACIRMVAVIAAGLAHGS